MWNSQLARNMESSSTLKDLPFYQLSDADFINEILFGAIPGFAFEKKEFYDKLIELSKCDILRDLQFDYRSTDEFNKFSSNLRNSMELTLIHLNIRSLNKNCMELYNFLQLINLDFDLIVLSEIWSCNVSMYHTLFAGYTFYYDLPMSSNVGGVGIYVKNTLNHGLLDNLNIASAPDCMIENVWLDISKNSKRYIIGGIYRHPGQNVEIFTDLFERQLDKLNKMKLPCLIAGDINIDLMKYGTHHVTNNHVENLLLHNFYPTVIMPTRIAEKSATLIDHVYFSPGSRPCKSDIQSGNLWCDITDHLPNYFVLMNTNSTQKKTEQRPFVRLYSANNIQKFKDQISNIDWDQIYLDTDTNTAYAKFEQEISKCFNHCFPIVRLSRKHARDKKWMTAGLAVSSKTKNKLYRKWLKSQSPHDELKYKNFRKIFKQVTAAAEASYYSEQFDTRTNSAKQLWLNLNSVFSYKKPKSRAAIPSLDIGGRLVSNTKDICNGLNEFYCSVGDKLVQSLEKCTPTEFMKYCPQPNASSMFCKPVDPGEIQKIIMRFKSNKSSGADNIGPKVLKEICTEICCPLAHICNLSFGTGVVPDSLKLAKVIPVYKKGDKSQPGNYRPISLLSVFDKVLEKLMCQRLCDFLQLHNILYEFQFGFRKHHSTVLAIMEVIDNIYQHLDAREFTLGVYLDLQKAFDTVNHEILLYKLSNYGIRGVVLKWFKNYLSGRKQFTSVAGVHSEIGTINTGVPQGSVLGPLLFLLYVNDISNAVPGAKIKLFADDTNLFLHDRNLSDLYCKANSSLEQLHKWFTANKLSLSIGKTYYSVFGAREKDLKGLDLKINDKNIVQVESCKYLGIYIDSKLSWQQHIDFVYKKIMKFTSIFYKIRTKINSELLKTLYFAFVYPHILYGIEIYGNTYHTYLSKLEILNNKILRIVQKKPKRTHTIDLYKFYGTLPLSLLHNYQILLLLHKFVHHPNKLPSVFQSYFMQNQSIHHYDTREKCHMHLVAPHTTYGKRLIKYKGSQFWNDLPETLKSIQSVDAFKTGLRDYLLLNT